MQNNQIDLDDDSIAEARRLSGQLSANEVVNAALREFIARRQQVDILDLVGLPLLDPKYEARSRPDMP